REDLKTNKINQGNHGFEFTIPTQYQDGKEHTIQLLDKNKNPITKTKYKQAQKIKGSIQSNIKGNLIKGWIAEIGNDKTIDAYLKIENQIYPLTANIFREDLKTNNINQGYHGFEFRIPNEFIDGNTHQIELLGPDHERIYEIDHIFNKFDYENNIERFFAYSMISPEIELPTTESRKKILAVMNNIAKYLLYQVNEMPLVSIIMPVYNRENYISNAINSVLNQSYKNFELILIDDSSTDNTVNIINEFKDDRIRLLKNKSNMGVSKSRNIGLKESKGKYIMYLDSDNDWEPDYLKATVGAFETIPDADALYSGQYVYEENKDNLKFIRYGTINKGLLKNRNYVDLNCFSHTRKIYEKEGGFDEKLSRFVDWDLILKYMTNGKMYSIPFVLSNYYFNIAENSISSNQDLIDQSTIVIEKQEDRLNSKVLNYDMKKNVSVIIPSYESLNDLKECLESLFSLKAPWLEIIVVDNNSSENVIKYLVKLKNEGKIKLILNKENLGFTYAVTQGIEISEINNDIVLLNNDAVITKNAIQLLQKAAYELDNCGLTVPQQVLPANTKTINIHVPFALKNRDCDVNLSANHKNIINVPLFHNGEFTEVSFAPFFCVYIKRETYNKSIGLDAELGRHFRSDMIYCNYVRTVLNEKIYHVSDAIVYHKLQQSTSTLKEKSQEEHDLLYVQNRWSEEEQEKYGFKRAKWDL
ncbi:MAG: glycosyltransferase, partial [Methanosphaera sp.]|nr:glycosyltransferase [Methanosphaera sp.]